MAEEDIIYGKKRHFFGGIEPSNMLDFKVHPKYTYMEKTETLSPTTYVRDQSNTEYATYDISSSSLQLGSTITVSGNFFTEYSTTPKIAVLSVVDGLVKYSPYLATFYPSSESGNEEILLDISANTFDSLVFMDVSVAPNRAVENELTFTMNKNTMTVNIVSELPNDTVIEGQTLCTVAGAIIRRKTDGYPVNEFDGTLVADIKNSCETIDSDVEDDMLYYYAAFPYTTQEVFNRNPANRASLDPENRTYYLYGFDLDTTDSDPDTRVSYPSDVDNADFTPAAMDYSTSKFNYGDWPSTPGEKFMPRPCVLNYDGTIQCYLDPDNYTKTIDGDDSGVTSSTVAGNAMVEWPKIYTHREIVNGVYKFRCSDIPLGDDWDCWCNYDDNNNEIDHFYTAIYLGTSSLGTSSDQLRSKSGCTPTTGKHASANITYAEANGDGWYTDVLADRLLIQDLLIMMGRSTDGQYAFGVGNSNSSAKLNTGHSDKKGMFWGDNTLTKGVKVFGMEDFWGNISRDIAGWIIDNTNNIHKIKVTRGTHDGTTVSDYNTKGDGYLEIPFTSLGTKYGASYIKAMSVNFFGRLPDNVGGSSSTYEEDIVEYTTDSYTAIYPRVGGDYLSSETYYNGPFAVYAQSSQGLQSGYTCAALSYKPLAE